MAFGAVLAAPAFADPPPPQVESISPDHGPWAGGTSVVITGANFTGTTAVEFGEGHEAASFTVNSDTEITAVSPERSGQGLGAAVVDISINGPGGLSQETPSDRFSYGPTIDTLVPKGGPAAGGTAVTLFGYGLEETTAVDFGSIPAENFTVNSDGSVTAISPPRGAGETIVPITVTTPEGTSENYKPWVEAMPVNFFTYGPTVTSVTPAEGPETGGTVMTIHGTGFDTSVFFCLCGPFVEHVSFGPAVVECGFPFGASDPACAPVEFEVVSDSEIIATTPPGSGTVDVGVSTRGGSSPVNPTAQFSYTGVPPPGPPEEPQVLQLLNCSVQAGAISICSGRSVDASAVAPIVGPTARLYRGKTLYAKGTARVHRSHSRLLLDPLRSLAPGRYMLVLSRPGSAGQGSNWPRREPVIVK